MTIQYIVEIFYSKRDISGNVYAIAKITRTSTGSAIICDRHWGSDSDVVRSAPTVLNVNWNEIYEVEHRNIGTRDQRAKFKSWLQADYPSFNEHDRGSMLQAFAEC